MPHRSFVKEARELGEGVIIGQGEWRQRLDANRRAFAEEFTARPAFRDEFPESLTAAQYVERLNARASGALSAPESAALVAGLEAGTETRGSALLKVADDEDCRRRELAPAFVLMQYLGYLRRDPDFEGYEFWLGKLNQFGGDFQRAELVKAFLSSDEYRRRFLEPQQEAAFGTPFTLGYGETAVVQPDKLRVTLIDVGFDSRCPRGTQCAQPGSLSILLDASKPGGEAARFILSIPGLAPRPHPANTPVSALGYTFRLLQADEGQAGDALQAQLGIGLRGDRRRGIDGDVDEDLACIARIGADALDITDLDATQLDRCLQIQAGHAAARDHGVAHTLGVVALEPGDAGRERKAE